MRHSRFIQMRDKSISSGNYRFSCFFPRKSNPDRRHTKRRPSSAIATKGLLKERIAVTLSPALRRHKCEVNFDYGNFVMSVSVKNPGLSEIDERCIETIRFLSMEAVQKANSGHPGMPMGMASATYVLWTKYMKHNPSNPKWQGGFCFYGKSANS